MNEIASGASGASNSQQYSSSTSQTNEKSMLGKDTFMKLLVAQVKNQNPLNPADGVEFVTQLAQFTQLEQTMDMRSELAEIRTILSDMRTIFTPDSSGATENV